MDRRATKHPRTRRALERSLTRLRVFIVASALPLASGALVLGSLLGDSLRRQALDGFRVLARRPDAFGAKATAPVARAS